MQLQMSFENYLESLAGQQQGQPPALRVHRRTHRLLLQAQQQQAKLALLLPIGTNPYVCLKTAHVTGSNNEAPNHKAKRCFLDKSQQTPWALQRCFAFSDRVKHKQQL